MSLLLAFPVLQAALNRLRGSSIKFPYRKPIIYALMGIMCSISHAIILGPDWKSYVFGFCAFAGFWGWGAPGWGKYFTAFHGWLKSMSEHEIWIIDKLADIIEDDYSTEANRRRWGVAAMSMRGLLILPVFATICLLHGVWLPLLFGFLVGIFQGFVYGAMRYINPDYRVEVAEIVIGFAHKLTIIGSLFYVSVGAG